MTDGKAVVKYYKKFPRFPGVAIGEDTCKDMVWSVHLYQ